MDKIEAIIADDESKIRTIIQKKIDWNRLGISLAAHAEDGDQLCQLIEQIRPQIVLTDMRMPGKSGSALIRWIAEKYPNIQILVISGHGDFEYMKQAVASSIVDYIIKPVDSSELNASLEQAVQRIKSNNEKLVNTMRANQSAILVKENLLNRFISGVNVPEEEIRQMLGISQDCNKFRVGLILFKNFSEVSAEHYERDIELLLFSSLNILNELLSEKGYAFCQTGANKIILILWDGGNEKEAMDNAGLLCVKMHEVLGMKVQVSISPICEGLQGVPLAFEQADSAAGCFAAAKELNVVLYDSNNLSFHIQSYISENYAGHLTAEKVAAHFYVSTQYLGRIYKAQFGMTVFEYITALKIEKSKELLRGNQYKSKDVVDALGFLDESHFSKVFKKHVGVSPRTYRKSMQYGTS